MLNFTCLHGGKSVTKQKKRNTYRQRLVLEFDVQTLRIVSLMGSMKIYRYLELGDFIVSSLMNSIISIKKMIWYISANYGILGNVQ